MGTEPRRVAITGIGVVSPCGIGADAFWAGLHRQPAVGNLRPVSNFDPVALGVKPDLANQLARYSQFALVAAREAARDARLAHDTLDADRLGVCVGTAGGGGAVIEEQALVLEREGAYAVSALCIPMAMANAAGAALSLDFGAQGPCETISNGCASGTHALATAAGWIKSGQVDVVVAGASDSVLFKTAISGFENLGALSPTGFSRPFDDRADGYCIGEGAAFLILEAEEHARARGVQPYAYLAGAASRADAHHLIAPDPHGTGAQRCLRAALQNAAVSAEEIDHINGHGTSMPLSDMAEATAIAGLFGRGGPSVTSIKGVTGHPMGAAGAMSAAALALSYRHRSLPPIQGTDPGHLLPGIDAVLEAREWEPKPAASTVLAFGGLNAALVMTP